MVAAVNNKRSYVHLVIPAFSGHVAGGHCLRFGDLCIGGKRAWARDHEQNAGKRVSVGKNG